MDTVDYAEELFDELETLNAEIARLTEAKAVVEADIEAYVKPYETPGKPVFSITKRKK